MIIPNGTIQYKRKPDTPGLDPATGHALRPTTEWTRPVPCQWTAARFDRTAMAVGETLTAATYTVLVEGDHSAEEQARLTGALGEVMAEGTIRRAVYLRAVGQTEITL